jgi:hypothetical protein
MTGKKKSRPALREIKRALYPDYLLFCENVLRSYIKDVVSFANVIDVLWVKGLPHELSAFWMVAAFIRNPSVSRSEFEALNIVHRVEIETPGGKCIDLETYPVDLKETSNPYIYRLIIDFSDGLSLTSEGIYIFRIYQSESNAPDPALVLQTMLPVKIKTPTKDQLTLSAD